MSFSSGHRELQEPHWAQYQMTSDLSSSTRRSRRPRGPRPRCNAGRTPRSAPPRGTPTCTCRTTDTSLARAGRRGRSRATKCRAARPPLSTKPPIRSCPALPRGPLPPACPSHAPGLNPPVASGSGSRSPPLAARPRRGACSKPLRSRRRKYAANSVVTQLEEPLGRGRRRLDHLQAAVGGDPPAAEREGTLSGGEGSEARRTSYSLPATARTR